MPEPHLIARDPAPRLVLGTVQFGLPYGVANRHGRPDAGAVTDILEAALYAGVTMLDTAANYGDSESVLGLAGLAGWQVITKVASLEDALPDRAFAHVVEEVARSLDRLRLDRVYGVLIHDAKDLTGAKGATVTDALEYLRAQGLVEHYGVSIYQPDDLAHMHQSFRPEIVQAPVNILDQRMLNSGAASRLTAAGCEVHARSLFLQGLLLMQPSERPKYFAQWSAELKRFDTAVSSNGMSALALCLNFLKTRPEIQRMVVGVETAAQLRQILEAFGSNSSFSRFEALACGDDRLIEPRNWKVI